MNGGKGDASRSPGFVITNVGVLDGTEVMPIDLEAATAALVARAHQKLENEDRRLQAAIDAATRKLPSDAKAVEQKPTVAFFRRVEWDDKKKLLEYAYLQVSARRYVGNPVEAPQPRCSPGQPCAQPQMRIPTYEIGASKGLRQHLSAQGVLVDETFYEPQLNTSLGQ